MGNSLFVRATLNRQQNQPQVTDSAEDAMQSSLVHQPADNGLAFWANVNHQVIEPVLSKMPFKTDLVNNRTVTVVHSLKTLSQIR